MSTDPHDLMKMAKKREQEAKKHEQEAKRLMEEEKRMLRKQIAIQKEETHELQAELSKLAA